MEVKLEVKMDITPLRSWKFFFNRELKWELIRCAHGS